MFAEVVLTKNSKAIDMVFTYKIPDSLMGQVEVGSKVIVPFGMNNALTEGFVMNLTLESTYKKLKNIKQVIGDIGLSGDKIELIHWLRENYLCTYSEAIGAIVPSGTKLILKTTYKFIKEPTRKKLSIKQVEILNYIKSREQVNEADLKALKFNTHLKELMHAGYIEKVEQFKRDINISFKRVVKALEGMAAMDKIAKRAKKQREIYKFICEVSLCDVSLLYSELKCTKTILDKLVDLNLVEVYEVEKFRKPEILKSTEALSKNPLTQEQEAVYESIENCLAEKRHDTYLLHGVTGSGKTEVYMQLAERVLSENKQVIILVPEIALTPQIVAKFIKRFGNTIAIMHSKVSQGERYDQYRSIQAGNVSIVIGARSAVFSPCDNLGLIIIDEEHEGTYKSDANPKYNTIEVAKYITQQASIPLLLASATPSLTSYHNAEIGEYTLLEIKNRFNNYQLPKVSLVDMREELISGNKSMFSHLLLEKMNETLLRKEQIILFYNRKGYSTHVSCRTCGHVLKCPKCEIALTYHHKDKKSKCSYCDYTIKVPENCPACKSNYFKYFGAGTEKVEALIATLFPHANIARLDSETTSKKGTLESIIGKVESGHIDILIGTQMVTKGLDFKNVTLVGALSADITLNLPDYRSPEKTFQLLTQVAGRAGRGEKPGEVVIQTYAPDNYAIYNSIRHDYKSFYNEEKQIRELFGYPPYKEIVSILIVGENENDLIRSSHNLYREIERFIDKKIGKEKVNILGPNPAIFAKINNKYRWQIILKFDKMDLVMVRNILNYVCITNRGKVVLNDIYISININPMSLL